jgi:spore germination cell wall hydrolase CwlJ-like protein
MSAMPMTRPRAAGPAEVLALTLWGEAGDRPVRAMEAVASVIMARVRLAARPDGPARFGLGVVGGVPRALPVRLLAARPPTPPRAGRASGQDDLGACRRVAARAIAGALPDPTDGATHYHDALELPRWALGRTPTAELGGLVFYRLAE